MQFPCIKDITKKYSKSFKFGISAILRQPKTTDGHPETAGGHHVTADGHHVTADRHHVTANDTM